MRIGLDSRTFRRKDESMSPLSLTLPARVGTDGVLSITVPLGSERAQEDVRVRIESSQNPNPYSPFGSKEEWWAFVDRMSGSWQGEFHRPESLIPEERMPLS
jgi:hypothetical protein